jgi:DNA-binding GntR family transcriptional regulator
MPGKDANLISSPKQLQTLNLQEIDNAPLRLKIADLLREAIFSGNLIPGQALTESAVATQLKVSRAPVREAIRMLSKEGLVETVPYKGTTVRKLERRDIEEIYSLRELLEAFAVRRIIQSSEPSDFSELDVICKNMQRFAKAKELDKLNLEDERFHKAVIGLAHHHLLSNIWNTLSLRVRQIMALRNQQNQDPMQVAMNHPPIVAALKARRLDDALALVHDHVLSAADLILDQWQGSDTL